MARTLRVQQAPSLSLFEPILQEGTSGMQQHEILRKSGAVLLYSLLPILAAVLIDLSARGSLLFSLSPLNSGFYIWSCAFMWLAWQGVAATGRQIKTRMGKAPSLLYCGTIGSLYSVAVVSVQAYRAYFGAYPNLFTFEFFYEEFGESIHILSTGTTPLNIVFMILGGVLFGAYAAGAVEAFPLKWRKRPAQVAAVVGIITLAPFHNNARTYPGAFLPEIQATFCFTKATQNALAGNSKPIRILSTGNRRRLPKVNTRLPFNVLFVIHESLRADRLSLYGYDRQTTPLLDQFIAERPHRTVVFKQAYANATRTMLAFPGLLSGVSPAQPASLLHRAPLFFDYGKMFENSTSFLISAHKLEWGNVIEFLSNSSIDYLWHKSTGDVPAMHRRAVDDKYLPLKFSAFLEDQVSQENDNRFFGVIHFRGTHGPYHSSEDSRHWPMDSISNRYDNSIAYLDGVDSALREVLKERQILNNTLIISTADHGEALGEHGYKGHVHTFFEEEAHVPMWIHLPDSLLQNPTLLKTLQANADGQNAVANTDIVPTVLQLIGLDTHPSVQESLRRLPGQSLGRPLPPHRPVIMQNHNDINNRYLYGGVGLVLDGYKYLLRTEEQRVWEEAYDLRKDPREENNLWPLPPQRRQAIYDALMAHPNSRQVLISQKDSLEGIESEK